MTPFRTINATPVTDRSCESMYRISTVAGVAFVLWEGGQDGR